MDLDNLVSSGIVMCHFSTIAAETEVGIGGIRRSDSIS